MSGHVGCSRRRKRERRAMAASPRLRGRQGSQRSTIGRGLKDLDDPASLSGEVRRPGSGRPALTKTDATLLEDLRQLLEPATKGDPMRLLRWVSKSHAKLAAALCAMGHRVSKSTVPKLLAALRYRRQVNCKTLESSPNPSMNTHSSNISTRGDRHADRRQAGHLD